MFIPNAEKVSMRPSGRRDVAFSFVQEHGGDMGRKLFSCEGGQVLLPDIGAALISRSDGGNLIVNPPRDVWERSELNADELKLWSCLVAATGQAMLEVLPQLKDGCINYWEAGNWALNEQAEPKGFKAAKTSRSVHLHLLGRNPRSSNPDVKWGEAPKFPDYADRLAWTGSNELLNADECNKIVFRLKQILILKYQFSAEMMDNH
ncbi:MAG: hypothetical protein ACREO1_03320 [Arenimonas sp.]